MIKQRFNYILQTVIKKKKIEMQRESHGTRITLNGIDKNALSPLFYNIIIKMVRSIRTRLDVWEY